MKIAIASDDGRTITRHFGRTKGFVIVDVEADRNFKTEFIPNTFTHHATEGHAHGQHGHSHAGILKALDGCGVVISRGMGRRLYEDLEHAGKQAFITSAEDVEQAINLYLAGTLDDDPEKGCHGHQHSSKN